MARRKKIRSVIDDIRGSRSANFNPRDATIGNFPGLGAAPALTVARARAQNKRARKTRGSFESFTPSNLRDRPPKRDKFKRRRPRTVFLR